MHSSSLPPGLLLVASLFLALALLSCSSGPPPLAVGSPAWHWQNAATTWEAGDLEKTSDNLEPLVKAGGEYADRAQLWRLVITGGVAVGYIEMSDAFEAGAKAHRPAATDFRRHMNTFRSAATNESVQFYETYMEFKKANPAGPLPLAFSFPKGSAQEIADLKKASEGFVPSDDAIPALVRQVLQRSVLLAACDSVGAGNDPAKAQQVFGGQDPTVPKDSVVLALAQALDKLGNFYSPEKQDNPQRFSLFKEQALETLQSLPETDETKKLIGAIEKDLKAAAKK
jgi:hypothetical protein